MEKTKFRILLSTKRNEKKNDETSCERAYSWKMFVNAQTALDQFDREFLPQMKTIAQK